MPEESAPPVVAVVVASDSGPWLESCLGSLSVQDYQNLTTIVIDAASESSLAAGGGGDAELLLRPPR